MSELVPGQRLGRYELVCPFGQGGMATVWLARLVGTRGFNKPVAIKVLLPSIQKDADAERMFQNEAGLASRIRHPNVVEILDFGDDSGVLYLVMEWVHGESLAQLITAAAAKQGGMPLGIALRIVSQICAGLQAAHELTDESGKPLGVVHRDVSPQNVLVGFNGVVTLVDFGIAKVTAEANHLTQGGMIKGKISYMAPEQIRLEALDRRTDVFAVGILLYVLTTGRHPFRADEVSKTALAITSGAPVIKPTKLIPEYPERLERVVLKALAKDPEQRYATTQELGEDLVRTMPPSRVAPHEEIQKYVAELVPESLARHQELIRKALGVRDPAGGLDRGMLPKTAQSSSTLRAVSVSDATSNAPISDVSGASPVIEVPSQARPRGRAATTLIAVAAGAVIGAAAIVALLSTRTVTAEAPHMAGGGAVRLPLPSIPAVEVPPLAAVPSADSATRSNVPEPAPSAEQAAPAPKIAVKKGARPPGPKVPKPRPAATESTGLKDPYAH